MKPILMMMKLLKLLPIILFAMICTSCEQIFDELIDAAIYGNEEANCKVIYQSSVRKITEGRAELEVKVKNKGALDASDLIVFASLEKDGQLVEEQSAYVGYLSSKQSERVIITFYKIIYGSEYDDVDIHLAYSEVERERYDDDDNW